MASFADVQYCIYADIVGWWVRKSPFIDGPFADNLKIDFSKKEKHCNK
jgi:hypothetical protein